MWAPLLLLGTLSAPQDLPSRVGELLEARCAGCHVAGSEEPKAARKWDQALDLAATVESGLIVPGDPDASDLYFSLEEGDMPPPDSDVPPLSEQELATVAEWIRAGAEPPRQAQAAPAVQDEQPAAPDGLLQMRPLRWIARFHPLIVHFPVALLSVALLAELLARILQREDLRTTATFCLILGALSAVPSAALGWLLAANSSHRGAELELHRWMGVATALIANVGLFVALIRPRTRLFVLLAVALLVGFTGHTGGIVSYGADWLDFPG